MTNEYEKDNKEFLDLFYSLQEHDISKLPDELGEFKRDLERFLELVDYLIYDRGMELPRRI